MGNETDEIISLLRKVQAIAEKELSITNILQPGIIKELMMAEILGHKLINQKDSADAEDEYGSYEYLASIRRVNVKTNKGCSFQMDRMTPSNLQRVKRNKAFYFGIFKNHLEIDEIWKVTTNTVLEEVNRQLTSSKNNISHVNFLLKWLKSKGVKIYPNSKYIEILKGQ